MLTICRQDFPKLSFIVPPKFNLCSNLVRALSLNICPFYDYCFFFKNRRRYNNILVPRPLAIGAILVLYPLLAMHVIEYGTPDCLTKTSAFSIPNIYKDSVPHAQLPVSPMSFLCFVCDKSFSRLQDRSSHIRLKRDDAHQHYLRQQEQNLTHQFSTTVEAATSAAATITSARTPILDNVSVQWNDVDCDDLPSSWNMDVDSPESDAYSDDEESIISGAEVPVVEDDDNDESEIFVQTMAAASHALGGLDLDDIPEAFDFLPGPDLDVAEGEAGPGPSTAAYRRTRRTLIEIDAEQPTYKWHQTAGQVYGHEPTIHNRWQALFNAGPESQQYKPFHNRLDWEIAQWAVKEKIHQKSFNRLLNIPQVTVCFLFSAAIRLMFISG